MYKSKYCEVNYIDAKDAILCKWLQKCSAEEYRKPLEYGLELLKMTNATTWITDTTNGFESDAEDTEWLLEEFIPQTIASECKRVVFIIAQDSPLKEEIDEQSKALSEYFEVLQVESLEEIENYKKESHS